MSELSERLAAEHKRVWNRLNITCLCGWDTTAPPIGDRRPFIAHVAEVTEAAVRETIAAESVTEWGVRFPSGKVVSHGPSEQSARDSAAELGRITNTSPAVVFATTTPWKDTP